MLSVLRLEVSSALDLNPLLDLTSHVGKLSTVLQEQVFFRNTIQALIFKTLSRRGSKQVRLSLEISHVGEIVRILTL